MPVKNPPVSPQQAPASNSSVSTLLGIPKNTPLLWGETWSLALQALRANKVRAMLTMLGVIIGSACIVLVVTVALAGRVYITSLIEGVGSNLIYGELVHTSENQHAALADQITMADMQAAKEQLPNVAVAAGTHDLDMTVVVNGVTKPVKLVGVTRRISGNSQIAGAAGPVFRSGRHDHAQQSLPADRKSGEAGVSEREPDRERNAAGRSALHGDRRVPGENGDVWADGNFGEFLDRADWADSILHGRRLSCGLSTCRPRSAEDVPGLTAQVTELLKSRHRPGAEYQIQNLSSLLDASKKISLALTVLLIVVAMIALTISGIGIMNIMLVTVTERTREIGIRKAIGAPRNAILYQFLTEALLISGTGALAGIAIGVAMPIILNIVLRLIPAAAGIHIPISAVSVVLAFLVSCSTGLLFGYLPANRAAKLHPTESLRYE